MIQVTSPANIALIKYMGKKDHNLNIPSNASLSWTTEQLYTQLVAEPSHVDSWEPLDGEYSIQLSDSSIERFLKFWQFLKSEFQISECYVLKTNNNFPFGCGLASSASSFSSLVRLACKLKPNHDRTMSELAALSAQGSGSSCRSLLSGWVEWNENGVHEITDIPYKNIIHKVVILEREEKKVSSSLAHKRISSSLLNEGRSQRANLRLQQLKDAFASKQWSLAFQICWAEFKDMHALFETSMPAFTYMNAEAQAVLNHVQKYWHKNNDGPLVTMDAGPNVHMIFRQDQEALAHQFVSEYLKGKLVL